MREKLLTLMQKEGLTASRLAELLGIRSSGISHIISERNKPSFDLLQKILKRFPNINPDWLLLDSDQMYRDENLSRVNITSSADEEQPNQQMIFSENDSSTVEKNTNDNTSSVATSQQPLDTQFFASKNNRQVKRVIILYEDHTFESYEK